MPPFTSQENRERAMTLDQPDPVRGFPTRQSCHKCGYSLYRIIDEQRACMWCGLDWDTDPTAFVSEDELEIPVDKSPS